MHSEWSSCLSFLCHNKKFFLDNGFKSACYDDLSFLEQSSPPDFATMEQFKFEMDRHRVIVALLISDFFLFIMKHLKSNHVVQFIYISQLVVDANGVLVLLKFLNQDFAKVDFTTNRLDKKFDFLESAQDLEMVMEWSINSLLKLMYKTCKNQGERIKSYLVQYKAAVSSHILLTPSLLLAHHETADQ